MGQAGSDHTGQAGSEAEAFPAQGGIGVQGPHGPCPRGPGVQGPPGTGRVRGGMGCGGHTGQTGPQS